MLRIALFAVALGVAVALPMDGPSGPTDHRPVQEQLSERLPELFGDGPELYGEDIDLEKLEALMKMASAHEEDCETDESWKFLPPVPCRVENSTYDALKERRCANDLQCNVGPINANLNSTAVRMYFCALPGKYMMFHACKIMDVDAGKEVRDRQCPGDMNECNFGPVPIHSNGSNYMATYCSSVLRPDIVDAIKEHPIESTACRIENAYGDDKIQRTCPMGYKCSKGPTEIHLEGEEMHAYHCKRAPMELDWDFTVGQTVQILMDHNVDPLVILVIINHMQEAKEDVTGKKLMHFVVSHLKEMMKEKEKEMDGAHDAENLKDIIHKLEHMSLLEIEVALRRQMMQGGKDEDLSLDDIKHMLHHRHIQSTIMSSQKKEEDSPEDTLKKLLAMSNQRDEEDNDVNKLALKILQQAQEAEGEEREHAMQLIMLLMAHNQKEENEAAGADNLLKLLMAQQKREEENDDEANLMKLLMLVNQRQEEESEESGIQKLLQSLVGNRVDDHESELKKLMAVVGIKSEREEDASLMKTLRALSFLQNVMRRVKMIEQSKDSDEVKMLKVIQGIREELQDNRDLLSADKEDANVMKVLKVLSALKGRREDDDKEQDAEIRKMIMIGRALKEAHEKEEEQEGNLQRLVRLLMARNRDDDDRELSDLLRLLAIRHRNEDEEREMSDVIRLLLLRQRNGQSEDRDLEDLLQLLVVRQLIGAGEDDRDNELLKLLVLSQRREDGDERDLLRLLALSQRRDDDDGRNGDLMRLLALNNRRENGDGPVREILQGIQQLSERREDNEGDRMLAFLRTMMGNDATLEDLMQQYHRMQMTFNEAELKKKYDQTERERGMERQAQELLAFLHQAHQAHNPMMGAMNGPYGNWGPMGQRHY